MSKFMKTLAAFAIGTVLATGAYPECERNSQLLTPGPGEERAGSKTDA